MFNPDWFEEEFMPSVYSYYLGKKTETDGENKLIFISSKQFSIIAQNSTKISETEFVYNWNGLSVQTRKSISKKTNEPYYTIDFSDCYISNHEKSASSVLEKLSYLARTQNPNFKEYAQTYYDIYMSLLHISELDMTDDDEFVSKSANKLNCYLTTVLESIGRLI